MSIQSQPGYAFDRSQLFSVESWLLYLIPTAALLTTIVVIAVPELFWAVLIADIWLLGYHHVIATYTRTSMDFAMFKKHWALNLLLPPAVVLGTTTLAFGGGALALTTIYIHWQLYHYSRQSEGISKYMAGSRTGVELANNPTIRTAFYLVPVTSFLTMAQSDASHFMAFPVWLPAPSTGVLIALWSITLLCLLAATQRILRAYRAREVRTQYVHYFASHVLVFVVAYAVIADVMLSWLMANVWHNAQYLVFVWDANRRRFNGATDSASPLLSTLSKPNNIVLYFAFCLSITFAIYTILETAHNYMAASSWAEPLVITAIIYQSINFHHYIVDSVIWRRAR